MNITKCLRAAACLSASPGPGDVLCAPVSQCADVSTHVTTVPVVSCHVNNVDTAGDTGKWIHPRTQSFGIYWGDETSFETS